ncbi:hypothetical protein LJC46_09605 [Desulfovibrio sp. OttesenSCG-928-G15]|nr:hypothetical protein [Desulfovibrio sp. OttesenSCG-928-G15]
MHSANIEYIAVGGKRYALDLFNPLDGLAYGNRALAVLGPAIGGMVGSVDIFAFASVDQAQTALDEAAMGVQGMLASALASCGQVNSTDVTMLMNEALRRCYTPQNESLADESVFNRWFREHPEDMYILAAHAMFRLVKDFFPKPPATGKSVLKPEKAKRA